MTANLQRLKRRAADFEQKRQLDRAVELYTQFLDEAGREIPDDDIPLFNRVGDLLVRRGDVSEALAYYERAVDMYAERGFLNNAIALCSKILRQSPGRATVYYKLGKISARKGFKSDARKNFLEYADRMQKAGQREEAFRALKEFASLFPDQDDIRLMLADLLSRENRKGEALEQLQALHEKLESEGRSAEARATIDRMKAIDPEVQPRVSGVQVAQQPNALVFLDVAGEPARREPTPVATTKHPSVSPPQGLAPALDGLRITFVPEEEAPPVADGAHGAVPEAPRADTAPETGDLEPPAPESDATPSRPGVRRPEWTGDFDLPAQLGTVDLDLPQESGAAASRAAAPAGPPLDGFEPTALSGTPAGGDASERPDERGRAESGEVSPHEAGRVASPPHAETPEPDDADDAQPLSIEEFAELPLTDVARPAPVRAHDLALPTALPHLGDHSVPAADAPAMPLAAAGGEDDADDIEDEGSHDVRTVDESAGWHTAEIPAAGGPLVTATTEIEPPTTSDLSTRPTEGMSMHDAFAIPTVEEASAIDLDHLLASPPSFGEVPSDGTSSLFPPLEGLTADGPPDGYAPVAELDSIQDPLDIDLPAEEPAGAAADGVEVVGREGAPAEDVAARGEATRSTPRHVPTPRPIVSLGGAEGHLRQRVELEPENWSLRRRFGEALLDAGDREAGLYELELALVGFESEGHLERATEVADVIIRVLPGSVRHHQKRVEYAVRAKDRARLIAAYLELADALFRTGASDKSVAVYARVAELDRDNERAVFALATLAPDRLLALRGSETRPGRWSDELAALDDGAPLRRPVADESPSAQPAMPAPIPDAVPSPPNEPALDAPADLTIAPPAALEPPDPEETLESIEAFAPDAGTDPQHEPPAPAAATSAGPSASDLKPMPPASPRVEAMVETPALFRAIENGTGGTNGTSADPPSGAAPRDRPAPGQSGFVDLGEWLRESEPVRSTRMVVEDSKPTGDEEADFAEMLRRFKRGLAENVDAEDFAAHYDLGVAFKEMGLIDEAIAEFQKSLRGADHRVRSYEALGQCFVEKAQYPIAAALLQRAIEAPGLEDQQLVGVLYLLAFACEHLGRHADALRYYQRVFAVDIEFRDVAQRVASMEHLTK